MLENLIPESYYKILWDFKWVYCCAILDLNHNFYFLWKSAGQISSNILLISWDEDSQEKENP